MAYAFCTGQGVQRSFVYSLVRLRHSEEQEKKESLEIQDNTAYAMIKQFYLGNRAYSAFFVDLTDGRIMFMHLQLVTVRINICPIFQHLPGSFSCCIDQHTQPKWTSSSCNWIQRVHVCNKLITSIRERKKNHRHVPRHTVSRAAHFPCTFGTSGCVRRLHSQLSDVVYIGAYGILTATAEWKEKKSKTCNSKRSTGTNPNRKYIIFCCFCCCCFSARFLIGS